MKKYGEVIGVEKRKALIRIYKEKNSELSPTSITVTASDPLASEVGDMVEAELNALLFLSSTLLGYLLPFIAAALAFIIVSPLTDNILIIVAVLLFALLLAYIGAVYLSRLSFFKRLTVCYITEKIELE